MSAQNLMTVNRSDPDLELAILERMESQHQSPNIEPEIPQKKTQTISDTLEIRRFSDIKAEAINWLWINKIPSKLTIIAGQPGKGKSQVSIALAATVSTGGRWPDGTPCHLGSVIFISNEDDPADTVKPRLQAAGADTSKVHIIGGIMGANGKRRQWVLEDAEMLRQLCEKIGDVRLIVIDPITAYVGKKDGHNTSDVRGLLEPLMALADRYKIAIVAVSHLNKSIGGDASSRVTGSGAFVAASRAALLVADHPEIEDAQIIATLKTNLSPDKSGFGYRIVSVTTDDGIQTSKVEWIAGSIQVDADKLLAPKQSEQNLDTNSAKGDAIAFLVQTLKNGPISSAEIKRMADNDGIAESTLKRAKHKLEIRSVRPGGIGRWMWTMPTRELEDQLPLPDNLDPLGPLDPLASKEDINNEVDTELDRLEGQEGQGGQLLQAGESDPLASDSDVMAL